MCFNMIMLQIQRNYLERKFEEPETADDMFKRTQKFVKENLNEDNDNFLLKKLYKLLVVEYIGVDDGEL